MWLVVSKQNIMENTESYGLSEKFGVMVKLHDC